MLEVDVSPVVDDQVWQSLEAVAALPPDVANLIRAAQGIMAHTRRNHHRVAMLGRVVLKAGEARLGAYTIDASPHGVGFFSPVQLFPQQRVSIEFDQWEEVELQVVRCRRAQESSYRIGACFPSGAMTPIEYRDFMRSVRV